MRQRNGLQLEAKAMPSHIACFPDPANRPQKENEWNHPALTPPSSPTYPAINPQEIFFPNC